MNGNHMVIIKRSVLILILFTSTWVYGGNKGIEGDWRVILTDFDKSFIVMISTKSDGTLAASTPEGISFENVTFENGKLHLEGGSPRSIFEGMLKEDGLTIEGKWEQQGEEMSSIFMRIDKVETKIGGESDTEVAGVSTEQLQDRNMLVAWWKFDNDANDSAGANHGTPHGGPTFEAGKFGQAISLDGDDYVDYGNSSVLNFGTGDWTISAWIQTTQTGTDEDDEHKNRGTVFANGGDQTGGIRYALIVNETSLGRITLVTDDDKIKVQATSPTVVNDGIWHHIVGMRNADRLRIYVDGKLDETSFIPSGYDLSGVSQHNVFIGIITDHRDNSLAKHFVGLIDEVCVFTCALDADSIGALFSGGDPVKVAQEVKVVIEPRSQQATDGDIEGEWKGTSEGSIRTCVMKIWKKTDDTLGANLTAEDSEGSPVIISFDKISFTDNKLRLESVSLQAIYKGLLVDNRTIKGQWQQQGQTLSFTFKRLEQGSTEAVSQSDEESTDEPPDTVQESYSSGGGSPVTTLILVFILVGVIGAIVLFVMKASIRR